MPTQSEGESVSRRVRMPTILDGSGSYARTATIERRVVVDDAGLGPEARRFALVRLALHEIGDDGRAGPGAVVQLAVEPNSRRAGGRYRGNASRAGREDDAAPLRAAQHGGRSEHAQEDSNHPGRTAHEHLGE